MFINIFYHILKLRITIRSTNAPLMIIVANNKMCK